MCFLSTLCHGTSEAVDEGHRPHDCATLDDNDEYRHSTTCQSEFSISCRTSFVLASSAMSVRYTGGCGMIHIRSLLSLQSLLPLYTTDCASIHPPPDDQPPGVLYLCLWAVYKAVGAIGDTIATPLASLLFTPFSPFVLPFMTTPP